MSLSVRSYGSYKNSKKKAPLRDAFLLKITLISFSKLTTVFFTEAINTTFSIKNILLTCEEWV